MDIKTTLDGARNALREQRFDEAAGLFAQVYAATPRRGDYHVIGAWTYGMQRDWTVLLHAYPAARTVLEALRDQWTGRLASTPDDPDAELLRMQASSAESLLT